MDAHAQKEIRVFAEAMGSFVKKHCPMAWEAFEEYAMGGIHLSRSEANILSTVLNAQKSWGLIGAAKKKQLVAEEASPARIERELAALKQKLKI